VGAELQKEGLVEELSLKMLKYLYIGSTVMNDLDYWYFRFHLIVSFFQS